MIADILYSVALAALYVFITFINTLIIVWLCQKMKCLIKSMRK